MSDAPYARGDLVSVAYAEDYSVVVRATARVTSVKPTSPVWNPSEQWWTVRCDETPGRECVAWVVDADGQMVSTRSANGGAAAAAPDGQPWIYRIERPRS